MAKAKTPGAMDDRRRENAKAHQKAYREQQVAAGMKVVTVWVNSEDYDKLLLLKDRFGLPTIRDTLYTTIKVGLDASNENVAAFRRHLPRE